MSAEACYFWTLFRKETLDKNFSYNPNFTFTLKILAMGTFGLPDRIEPKIKNPKLPFAITYALGYIVSRGLFLELKRVSNYNPAYF